MQYTTSVVDSEYACLKSFPTILDCIGRTPLVQLQHLTSHLPHITLLLKLEFYNPGASIKDRMVKYIIDEAEKEGRLRLGGTIIENTSGNTGAATAMIAAIRGYKAILTMTDKISQEKVNAARIFGAEVIICPSAAPISSPENYLNVAKRLAQETPNSFWINQHDNLKNPDAHYYTTAPEIWEQTQGQLDYFVAGASTGGTISGVGRYLKERNSDIQVVMPDPVGSIYHEYFYQKIVSKGARSAYHIEGLGKDHVAGALDFGVIDQVIQVSDEAAFRTCRQLAQKEGVLAGGSSGANVWTALRLAESLERPATIVTIAPDSGLKYLSKIFDPQWLSEHQINH